MKNLKIIFITGGVSSSIGKGVLASSIAGLLSNRNYKVKIKKIDPYLNVDPGTLSPIEHGEVFVTQDGLETDLDLGHYERLGGVITSKDDYITSGMIYETIIKRERRGDFEGKTVQVIPHFTNILKEAILNGTNDYDFLICEIGGTVGDMESNFVLECIRQIKVSYELVINVHVALMPYLRKAQEWKTKPVQHSVRSLLEKGISPDILVCRMEVKNTENWKTKLELLCNVKNENIFTAVDAETIYHAMKEYEDEGICKKILNIFNLPESKPNIDYLTKYIKFFESSANKINIALVGKYTKCKDAYISVIEALEHAVFANNVKLNLHIIDAENYALEDLKGMNGIFIPGGFGKRAIEGKIKAINYARNNNIPLLGMCLALQLSLIDGLRDIYSDANSTEFEDTPNPVVIKLDEWCKEKEVMKSSEILGASMRLGAYNSKLIKDTLTYKLYKKEIISERHRHRYIFNKKYEKDLLEVGIKISGVTDDENQLIEIIERPNLDFFIAVQFHAEFKSNIRIPHPLFTGFIEAIKKQMNI